MAQGTVELEGVNILKDTGNAILIRYEGETYWIPLSQVSDDSEIWKEGEEGTLTITEWIAKEKGLL